jgi:hypothetical protein
VRRHPEGWPNPSRILERVSLGWRFALVTAVTVATVVGAFSLVQLSRNIDHDSTDRKMLLDEFMGSLVEDIEATRDLATAQARIDRFSRQVLNRARSSVRLDLVDGLGQVVASSDPEVLLRFDKAPSTGVPYAQLPVFSPVLGRDPGTLAVWTDAPSFPDEARRRWRSWFLQMALLVLSVVGSLVVANHFLVARPLHRLQEGLRQMGHGYLGVLKDVQGAPEWRYLGHEIWRLGSDLEQTVRRLVEAQRRAMNVPHPDGVACAFPRHDATALPPGPIAPPLAAAGAQPARPGATGDTGPDDESESQMERTYLMYKLRLLESQSPDDPEVVEHARVTWEQDVLMAERLGDLGLRSRLDDAALRVLNPEAFARVGAYLSSITDSPPAWLGLREHAIRAALGEAGVSIVDLQRRAKHVAGIWRKMQALDIAVDQVQDVFGFRLIMPGTGDCYRALDALHRRFEPQLLSFKDYIARPKPNGYQSLHTHLRASEGPVFEVQLRTPEMHLQADGPDGDAAHWRYKKAGRGATRGALEKVGRGLLGRLFPRSSDGSAP